MAGVINMIRSTLKEKHVLLFGVICLISSCSNENKIEKDDCSTDWKSRTENHLWRASKVVFGNITDDSSYSMYYSEDEYNYWYFLNDTGFDINFPYSLICSYSCSYDCDTMFLDGRNHLTYVISFEGDRLLLTTINGVYTKTVYFTEEIVPDSNNLNLLISEKVDWNFFRKKYFFVSDTNLLKMDNYPPIQLDLSKENGSSYLIKQDTLFYSDSLDSYTLVFDRFDRKRIVSFNYIKDSVEYLVMYRDAPYNNLGN